MIESTINKELLPVYQWEGWCHIVFQCVCGCRVAYTSALSENSFNTTLLIYFCILHVVKIVLSANNPSRKSLCLQYNSKGIYKLGFVKVFT